MSLGVTDLPVEPLLQHVEALYPAFAHDQQFAVDRAVEVQRVEEIGEALRNILAGAGIEPALAGVAMRAGRRLDADAVPFPFREEIGGIELGEVRFLDRMRQHGRTKRCRIVARWFLSAAFQPGEQFGVGRRKAGPEEFDLLHVLVAECGSRGLCKPCRDADP